jgi:hypothetical protein
LPKERAKGGKVQGKTFSEEKKIEILREFDPNSQQKTTPNSKSPRLISEFNY